MNVLRAFKRTRFFLTINIIGLAIGLAVSIMLILFIVNELSYDKHFTNHERIVRLNTVKEENGVKTVYGINLRKAYTELPGKVPGIEAAAQIYNLGEADITVKPQTFQNLKALGVDPDFFKIFEMKFIEGTLASALTDAKSIVLTEEKAIAIFGTSENAIGKTVSAEEQEYTVSAVVEKLPLNTHFTFDILFNINFLGDISSWGGLEFFTYYLIAQQASVDEVRTNIKEAYQPIIDPWSKHFEGVAYGTTEKLTDIYLHSEASGSIGKRNSMSFVWLLSVLALLILVLALANFVNLFIAQGETRMNEIGVRKTNGARITDIVRQFFSEVSIIVLISFALAILLTIILTPLFSKLINKDIDLIQLFNPWFLACVVLLFIVTVTLSACYPSLYLSRFSPLDILAKRLKFSKQRLTVAIVVFQSIITIVLMSYIWIINRQASYLENLPLGYNPKNVVAIYPSKNIGKSYNAVKQELLSLREVKAVSGSYHPIGGGPSGQGISLLENRDKSYSINEYRILAGLSELMEFELAEGEFFKENAPDSVRQIMLNEAAVKMLNLSFPVAGKYVDYKGQAEIVGVVKDFYYEEPANQIQPLVLSKPWGDFSIYIKLDEEVGRIQGQEAIAEVFKKFDPEFTINPSWIEDIYSVKFDNIKQQSKIVLIASFLSMFIAMLGLVAVHLYATARRTKEIGIRQVSGATSLNIFTLLSYDIIKWVLIAGIIAVPIAYYLCSEWMSNFVNRTSLNWMIFVIPIFIQCIIAVLVTSGVSMKALSQSPVESLKKD